MNEHYLKVAKDENKCRCSLAVRLLGEGCRYCQPQEYIDRANARIAMQEEALKKIKECGNVWAAEHAKEALYASASPESIAAWEEAKLLPLQRQVASLHNNLEICLDDSREILNEFLQKYGETYKKERLAYQRKVIADAQDALDDTQATAEAYDKAHAAKVLEDAAKHCGKVGDVMTRKHNFAQGAILAHSLRVDFERQASELRAEAQKGSE